MWRNDSEQWASSPSGDRFAAALNRNADFFDRTVPIVVARAPGRLDVMGGIADYSGALVLQLPLAAATFVAAQPAAEPYLTIRTLEALGLDEEQELTIPLATLAPEGVPVEYEAARCFLNNDYRQRWGAYVAGVLLVLARERGLPLQRGVRLLIHSSVPPGKGVSSSAALEVATMQAVSTVYGLNLAGRELALLCQIAENQVVGAPCGIMDQMTSACGTQDQLLALLCQPAELQAPVALPAELEVWGIDSGIRHMVGGTDYGAVRIGAFMGYRIIADLVGLNISCTARKHVEVDDPHWNGYLANIAPSLWETNYREHIPETLDGASFLSRYDGTTDLVTEVDPGQMYRVRQPTAHPIYEHHRVQLFRSLLAQGPGDGAKRHLLGELMYQSHASYNACGLGSSGTDRLVELVRAVGSEGGLYGAKITGGGSGGTVAVLARRGASDTIASIVEQYERETGNTATIMSGSSPGAATFGIRLFTWH